MEMDQEAPAITQLRPPVEVLIMNKIVRLADINSASESIIVARQG
jgi:hypothetical protein